MMLYRCLLITRAFKKRKKKCNISTAQYENHKNSRLTVYLVETEVPPIQQLFSAALVHSLTLRSPTSICCNSLEETRVTVTAQARASYLYVYVFPQRGRGEVSIRSVNEQCRIRARRNEQMNVCCALCNCSRRIISLF